MYVSHIIELFKVNNRNTRKRGEICSKLTKVNSNPPSPHPFPPSKTSMTSFWCLRC